MKRDELEMKTLLGLYGEDAVTPHVLPKCCRRLNHHLSKTACGRRCCGWDRVQEVEEDDASPEAIEQRLKAAQQALKSAQTFKAFTPHHSMVVKKKLQEKKKTKQMLREKTKRRKKRQKDKKKKKKKSSEERRRRRKRKAEEEAERKAESDPAGEEDAKAGAAAAAADEEEHVVRIDSIGVGLDAHLGQSPKAGVGESALSPASGRPGDSGSEESNMSESDDSDDDFSDMAESDESDYDAASKATSPASRAAQTPVADTPAAASAAETPAAESAAETPAAAPAASPTALTRKQTETARAMEAESRQRAVEPNVEDEKKASISIRLMVLYSKSMAAACCLSSVLGFIVAYAILEAQTRTTDSAEAGFVVSMLGGGVALSAVALATQSQHLQWRSVSIACSMVVLFGHFIMDLVMIIKSAEGSWSVGLSVSGSVTIATWSPVVLITAWAFMQRDALLDEQQAEDEKKHARRETLTEVLDMAFLRAEERMMSPEERATRIIKRFTVRWKARKMAEREMEHEAFLAFQADRGFVLALACKSPRVHRCRRHLTNTTPPLTCCRRHPAWALHRHLAVHGAGLLRKVLAGAVAPVDE